MALSDWRKENPAYDEVPDDKLVPELHRMYGKEGQSYDDYAVQIKAPFAMEETKEDPREETSKNLQLEKQAGSSDDMWGSWISQQEPKDPNKPDYSWERAGGVIKEGFKDLGKGLTSGVLSTIEQAEKANLNYRMSKYRKMDGPIPDVELSPVEHGYIIDAAKEAKERLDRELTPEELKNIQMRVVSESTDYAQRMYTLAMANTQKKLAADPEYANSAGFWEDVLRMGPQLGGQLLVGLATGFTGSAVFMGLHIAGSTIEQLKAEGVDSDRAFFAGLANAMFQAPLEALALGKFTKFIKTKMALGTSLKKIMGATTTEWGTEFFQAHPEVLAEIWGKGENKSGLDMWKEYTDRFGATLQQGAYEGLVASVFPFGGGSVKLGSQIIVPTKTESPRQHLIKTIEESTAPKDVKKELIAEVENTKEVLEPTDVDEMMGLEQQKTEASDKIRIQSQQQKAELRKVSADNIKTNTDRKQIDNLVALYKEMPNKDMNRNDKARKRAANAQQAFLQKQDADSKAFQESMKPDIVDVAQVKKEEVRKKLPPQDQKIGWRSYSKFRGYNDQEIADFARFQQLAPPSPPQTYDTPEEMHKAAIKREQTLQEKANQERAQEQIPTSSGDVDVRPDTFIKPTGQAPVPNKPHIGSVFTRGPGYEEFGSRSKELSEYFLSSNDLNDPLHLVGMQHVEELEKRIHSGKWKYQSLLDEIVASDTEFLMYIGNLDKMWKPEGAPEGYTASFRGITNAFGDPSGKVTRLQVGLHPEQLAADSSVDVSETTLVHELLHALYRIKLGGGETSESRAFQKDIQKVWTDISPSEYAKMTHWAAEYNNQDSPDFKKQWDSYTWEQQEFRGSWSRLLHSLGKTASSGQDRMRHWEEVMTYAFSNPDIAKVLSGIQSTNPKTNAPESIFTRLVRALVGFIKPNASQSVMDDLVAVNEKWVNHKSLEYQQILGEEVSEQSSFDLLIKKNPAFPEGSHKLQAAFIDTTTDEVWTSPLGHFDIEGAPSGALDGFAAVDIKGGVLAYYTREEAGALVDPDRKVIDPDSGAMASEELNYLAPQFDENNVSSLVQASEVQKRARKRLSEADKAKLKARHQERGGRTPREAWAQTREDNQKVREKYIEKHGVESRWDKSNPVTGLSTMNDKSLEKEATRVREVIRKGKERGLTHFQGQIRYNENRLDGIELLQEKRVDDKLQKQMAVDSKIVAQQSVKKQIKYYQSEYKRLIRADAPYTQVQFNKNQLLTLMGAQDFYDWSGEAAPALVQTVTKAVPTGPVKVQKIAEFKEGDTRTLRVGASKTLGEARQKLDSLKKNIDKLIMTGQQLPDTESVYLMDVIADAYHVHNLIDDVELSELAEKVMQARDGADHSYDASIHRTDVDTKHPVQKIFDKNSPRKVKFDAYYSPSDGYVPNGYSFTITDTDSPAYGASFAVDTIDKATLTKKIRDAEALRTSSSGDVQINKDTPFKFNDDKMHKDSLVGEKGFTGDPWYSRFIDFMRNDFKTYFREFQELPRKLYSEVQFSLRQLKKGQTLSANEAAKKLAENIDSLTKDEFGKLTKISYMMDLYEQVKMNEDARAAGKKVVVEEFPYGWTETQIKSETIRLWEYIQANPNVLRAWHARLDMWRDLRSSYSASMERHGFNVADRLKRAFYFRHQVLDILKMEHQKYGVKGTGGKLAVPTRRSHLRKRKGGAYEMNFNYIQAEFEIMAQMIYDTKIADTLSTIMDKYGSEVEKDGYVLYQPREDSIFFMANSVPGALANNAIEAGLKDLNVPVKQIKKVLALGGKYKGMYLPTEIAETLNTALLKPRRGKVARTFKNALRWWKMWQLLSPFRVLKYNARNMTGDAEAMFVGDMATFKYMGTSLKDLWAWKTKGVISQDLQDWFDRGGQESTLQSQEMGQMLTDPLFRKQLGKAKLSPMSPFKWAGRGVRGATDLRESLLRFAAYKRYVKLFNSGKPIKNYAASMPEEVNALEDNRDKAFMMSNDLLGAYDRISVGGNWARDYVAPFWSFQEINMKRTLQFARNAVKNDDLMMHIGKKLGAKGVVLPIKLGKFAFKLGVLQTVLQVWNNWMHPEDEDALPDEMHRRAHIIIGSGPDNIYYFPRVGVLGDLLEWAGVDTLPADVGDVITGNKSIKEVIESYNYGRENALDILNKVVQSVGPYAKIPVELLTRTKLFPSFNRGQPITDYGRYFAEQAQVGPFYDALAGKPTKEHWMIDTLMKMSPVYKGDRKRFGWLATQQKIHDYKRKAGLGGSGFIITKSGNALYNMGLAWRYGDKKAVSKYLYEFLTIKTDQFTTDIDLLGTLEDQWEKLDPMERLPKTGPHRELFLTSLNKRDQYAFGLAILYYNEIKAGKQFYERQGK